MPELPEVETVRAVLAESLPGLRIEGVHLFQPKLLRGEDPGMFYRGLIHRTFLSVDRRAKFLLIHMDQGTLLIHLGMSGQVILESSQSASMTNSTNSKRHIHLRLELEGNTTLVYRDPRMFGRLAVIDQEQEKKMFIELGPEPLGGEFTSGFFRSALKHRRASIKAMLLDQKVVAGMGNIYADESLFRAGIRPHNSAGRISVKRIERLHSAILEVLRDAIHRGGSSLSDFLDPRHRQGTFQLVLQVYGREGKSCFRCGGVIHKAVVAQRGTHWCPKCQH